VRGSRTARTQPGEIERRIECDETILGHIDLIDACHFGDGDREAQKQERSNSVRIFLSIRYGKERLVFSGNCNTKLN
jgi:hypothetical protein